MKSILTLKKNYEFKNVLDKGKAYYGNQIIVYINKNKKEKNILGIAINTKLCKANKRNKLKRLIRENYRLIKDELEVGYNIVFLWNRKDAVNNANFFIIKEDMNKLLKRAEILK